MARKLLLIVNPCAGKRRIVPRLAEINAVLGRGGYGVDIRLTQRRGEATELIAARGTEYDALVCAGGDGTLNECICGLMTIPAEARPPIGYIAAGSTNDFANTLGLPKDILRAAELAVTGEPQPLDVGRFGERYFSYVASFGAFTASSYATPQSVKNVLGHLAYLLDGAKSITSIRATELTVTTETETVEGKFLYGGICNSTSMGGVVKLREGLVDLSDGKMELLLIRSPENPADLARELRALTTSNFDGRLITFHHCERATFTMPADPWTLDGERADTNGTVEIACVPGAIRMFR